MVHFLSILARFLNLHFGPMKTPSKVFSATSLKNAESTHQKYQIMPYSPRKVSLKFSKALESHISFSFMEGEKREERFFCYLSHEIVMIQ